MSDGATEQNPIQVCSELECVVVGTWPVTLAQSCAVYHDELIYNFGGISSAVPVNTGMLILFKEMWVFN